MSFKIYVRHRPGDTATLQHEAPDFDEQFGEVVQHFGLKNWKEGVFKDAEREVWITTRNEAFERTV